jgi:non-lysosomal glucosylceramidase
MKTYSLLFLLFGSIQLSAQKTAWPVLRHYEGDQLNRIAMPVGGIGTGTISFSGNGQWRDIEVLNKPGKGFFGATDSKLAPCFLVFTDDGKGNRISKALMGPLSTSDYEGQQGSYAPNHGIPRFSTATFDAAYPFAQLHLEDPEMPVSAKASVFNPYIPGNAQSSGIPIAVIRYELKNKTNKPLSVAIAGLLENFIGMDGSEYTVSGFDKSNNLIGAKNNRNTFRKTDNLSGIYMTSDSVARDADTWGTIALSTSDVNQGYTISYRTELNSKGWNANISDLWDDFSDDGVFKNLTFEHRGSSPCATLAVKFDLAPNETKEIQFFLTWDFPNRKDWFNKGKEVLGNYYSSFYSDAWEVAEKTLTQLPDLENKTLSFVNHLLESDYPQHVKEAALFNSSTLRTQTTFRTRDGNFFGWEGIFKSIGSCYGNCTHVWNYEQASPFLFGELAKTMRTTEYNYGLNDSSGLMSFRVSLPLKKNSNWNVAAADGQMGTVMKVYREWQLSGDDEFLKKLWPGVKKALAFSWIPGGWDANKDGVMEGCQHNTMDIEYFGPNPEIEFWYLGALKAAGAMARYLKDVEFEKTCNRLFQSGSQWTDANLFNGEFYYQKIQPVSDPKKIAFGLVSGMGSKNFADPDFQIGEGCLVDQLVGQNMAHVCGLGYLTNPAHVKKAMQSIWKYNHVESIGDHFNNMRSYGLGKEAGLLLVAYPFPEKKPKIPLSYYAEVWTGLEYTAASGMIFEGMNEEAFKVVDDVRDRHDGIKRNPFNEAECGYHYTRAMASWSTIIALSGFNYSAVDGSFTITSTPGKYFWSNGYGWGMAEVGAAEGNEAKVKLTVHAGKLNLKSVALRNSGLLKLKKTVLLSEGNTQEFIVSKK